MPTLSEILDFIKAAKKGAGNKISDLMNQEVESLPMEGRANFLPYQDTIPGSVMNQRSLALPGVVAGGINAITAPARSMQGGYEIDEAGNIIPTFNAQEEAMNVAGNVMGGGMAASRAVSANPAGSLGMAYMPTRPKMPAAVGTRFEVTDTGGLLQPKPFKAEDYKGASIGVMPWDNSSRNRLITSVSEEELKNPVMTHGGQPYARDIEHQQQNIGGASATSIVNKIADRVKSARQENLESGGSGVILQTPITMGEFSENYSAMPTQVLFNLFDKRNPTKSKIKEINSSIRSGKDGFPDFKGIETEVGRNQLLSGGNGINAPGQLRKKFVNSMYTEGNEKYFGFNRQDISNAISEPSLIGVPRGYGMNTVISHGTEPLTISPSTNITYPTNFSGQYVGGLANMPIKEFLSKPYNKILAEYENAVDKKGRPFSQTVKQNAAIGALEKRKSGVFQKIDQEFIDKVNAYNEKFK